LDSNDHLGMSQHPAVVDAKIGGVRELGAGSGGTHAFSRIQGKQIAERHGLRIRSGPAPDSALLDRSRRESTSGIIIEPAAISAPG
jgi:hypothetical protein